MIRLAAFDLDGTLMGADQKIRPRVRDAVVRALDAGVVVTLATGRMFLATLPFARELNVTAPLICYQGGWIQPVDGPVMHRIALPTVLARAATDLADERGWHTVLYADGLPYIQTMTYPQTLYDSLLGEGVMVGEPWEAIYAARIIDKVLFVADPEHIPEMATVLQQKFAGLADVVQSHAIFIEVVPLGVDKGSALAWLAQHLGIPRDAVLAAGDQGNDLAMVKWAGTGVAMGNAIPAVQQAAAWIATPVTEDGAVAILERFVLDRRLP